MGGSLGTNPFAVSQHFGNKGYDVKWRTNLSKVSNNADAYIILYAWKKGSSLGAHYQAAYYNQYGKLVTTNFKGSYADFQEFHDKTNGLFAMTVLEINKTSESECK